MYCQNINSVAFGVIINVIWKMSNGNCDNYNYSYLPGKLSNAIFDILYKIYITHSRLNLRTYILLIDGIFFFI